GTPGFSTGPRGKSTTSIWNSSPQRELTTNPLSGKLGADHLLYTGVTRAKKLVVLAGSRRALAAAIRTKGAGRRHTALAHPLHPHPSPTIDPAQHQSGR